MDANVFLLLSSSVAMSIVWLLIHLLFPRRLCGASASRGEEVRRGVLYKRIVSAWVFIIAT